MDCPGERGRSYKKRRQNIICNELFKLNNDLSSAFRNSFAAKEKGMNGV